MKIEPNGRGPGDKRLDRNRRENYWERVLDFKLFLAWLPGARKHSMIVFERADLVRLRRPPQQPSIPKFTSL